MSRDVLDEAARLGASGERAALATVVRVTGSVPRRPGAKMIVRADGVLVDTVGGGRVEHEVVELARAVAAGERPPTRFRKHLVRDLAMCCGGEMEVWIEPLDAARGAVLSEAVRRRAARERVALRTELLAEGAKALVSEHAVLRTRRPAMEGDAFVEPLLPCTRLVVFGAGHIASALAPMASAVGFELVICDEDDTYRSERRFPTAARLLETFDPVEVERAIAGLSGDYVLVVTRDHAIDQALLEKLIGRTDLGYLGMVGSRGKLGRFRHRLDAKGLGDAAAWQRLRSPVGLDIGAETPEEIAVAIVAELVQTRARADA
jgi:xanthine dehydrogenase accessory factor